MALTFNLVGLDVIRSNYPKVILNRTIHRLPLKRQDQRRHRNTNLHIRQVRSNRGPGPRREGHGELLEVLPLLIHKVRVVRRPPLRNPVVLVGK